MKTVPIVLLLTCLGVTSAFSVEEVKSVKQILKVSSIKFEPFLTRGDNESHYEGFIPSLMDLVSQRAGFSYEIHEVKDNRFGRENDDGTWTGLIGEVARREADIAAAPLTITDKRMQVVDFSVPFMVEGRGVLVKQPNTTTWWKVTAADNVELLPKTSLEVDVQRCRHIEGAVGVTFEDLVSQEAVQFVYLAGGSTEAFVKEGGDPLVLKAYEQTMQRDGEAYHPRSYSEALELVSDVPMAAFIGDTSVLRYAAIQNCEYRLVDDSISANDYGLAMAKGSPLMARINAALLQLKNTGELLRLEKRWLRTAAPDTESCPQYSHMQHVLEHLNYLRRRFIHRHEESSGNSTESGVSGGENVRGKEMRKEKFGLTAKIDSDGRGGTVCMDKSSMTVHSKTNAVHERPTVLGHE